MSELRRNVVTNYVTRFATIAALFFLFPFVEHRTGLSVYGIYLLVTSLTTFFTLDLGMGTATVRYVAAAWVAGDSRELGRIVASSLVFFICLTAIMSVLFGAAMIVVWPSLHIPHGERHTALSLFIVVGVSQILIAIPLGVFNQVLIGVGRLDLLNYLQLTQLCVRVAATIALLSFGYGIVSVAVSEGILAVGFGIAAWVTVKRRVGKVPVTIRRASWQMIRTMAPFSLQLFIISSAALVILQADSFVVSLFLPVAAVTLYAAGYRIYQATRELTNALTLAVTPDATKGHVRDQLGHLQELFLRGTRYSNLLMLLFAVPGLLFAGLVLTAWGGHSFRGGAVVLQILLASQLVNNNHLVAIAVLTGQGNVALYARYHVLWAVSNIVLSVILVQTVGIDGVALGTAIPIVLLEPLYIVTALRQLGLHPLDFARGVIVPSFGCAVLIGVPLWLVSRLVSVHTFLDAFGLSFVWAVAFGALSYRVAVDESDRRRLMKLAGRVTGLWSEVAADV
jgi:O-antigen/teichoic acid export membrane protein